MKRLTCRVSPACEKQLHLAFLFLSFFLRRFILHGDQVKEKPEPSGQGGGRSRRPRSLTWGQGLSLAKEVQSTNEKLACALVSRLGGLQLQVEAVVRGPPVPKRRTEA